MSSTTIEHEKKGHIIKSSEKNRGSGMTPENIDRGDVVYPGQMFVAAGQKIRVFSIFQHI